MVAGDEGPRIRDDEKRRHIYCIGGIPVRIKIMRKDGNAMNVYRVTDTVGATGWQYRKPEGFTATPYFAGGNPFEGEQEHFIYWPEGEKDVDTLGRIGLANNAAQIIATGGFKWPQKAMQAIQNWNVGRNLDDLARLLTDPAATDQFRAIATAPRGSSKALALTARLAITGANSRNVEGRPRVEIDTTGWRGATGPPR